MSRSDANSRSSRDINSVLSEECFELNIKAVANELGDVCLQNAKLYCKEIREK